MRIAFAISMLLCLGPLGGCGKPAASGGKPVVVASIYPYAAIAGQLVAGSAEVVCLLPPGASPHHAPDTAASMAALATARLVILNGAGLDMWANVAAKAAGRSADDLLTVADALAEHVEPAEGAKGADHADHGHADHDCADHDHHHDGIDPHLWLDPVLGMEAVEVIADRLAAAMPDHAAAIRQRAEQMNAELSKLDADARRRLAPYAGQGVVTFHDAFGRLAARYGLEVPATLTPLNSPGDVTPAALARVLAVIRQHRLKVVFSEPQFSPDAAKMIEDKAGVRVLTLDPLGDPMNAHRRTYIELLRYNLDTLHDGLAGE